MQAVPQHFEFPTDRAEFRAGAGGRTGVELYRAHIVRHAYEPHTHDAYGFGVIEQGVERFRYKGSDLLAPPDSIVLMHPDVLHTGRPDGLNKTAAISYKTQPPFPPTLQGK